MKGEKRIWKGKKLRQLLRQPWMMMIEEEGEREKIKGNGEMGKWGKRGKWNKRGKRLGDWVEEIAEQMKWFM